MEEQGIWMESLYEKAKQYADTNIELAKLKAADKTSELISALVPGLAVVIFVLMFLLVGTIAVSLWLGELMGRSYYGFLCVAVFYLFAALTIHFFLRNSLKKKIADAFVSRLFN